MRFDSEEYLEAWAKSEGFQYPVIHDNMYAAAIRHDKYRRGLDLCCSSGLLGTRLMDAGFAMVGVDADKDAVGLATKYKIPMLIHLAKVSDTHGVDAVADIVAVNKLKTIYARRCFPELFGENTELEDLFFPAMIKAGIRMVIFEGRVRTVRATNRLSSVQKEAEMLGKFFDDVQLYGQVGVARL